MASFERRDLWLERWVYPLTAMFHHAPKDPLLVDQWVSTEMWFFCKCRLNQSMGRTGGNCLTCHVLA